ncbi:hypothetical protein BH23CHL2_BH23CHL2_12030 [soil metagenome]
MTFRFGSFDGLAVRHAMSMRRPDAPSEGDIAFARDTIPEHIAQNRAAFLDSAGFDGNALTLGRQIHGSRISVVTSADRGRGRPPDFDAIPNSDGLITTATDVVLGTIVADCVPILLYDPVQHALGLVHAGWRGTVAGIARNAVHNMAGAFGSRPADLHVGIGPSIGPCCYEVGAEVIDAWISAGTPDAQRAVVPREPRPHLDLWQANRLTLIDAGVPCDNIELGNVCTRCQSTSYFSHRAAMAGERARGRMIMVAQLTG